MARDPDQGGAFVFDLVDDDVADLEAPLARSDTAARSDPVAEGEPDGDDAGAAGPPPSGELGSRARALAPVGAALLAIVLGTGFAVDGLRADARMERMRDVPGGVVDVSSPLEEKWAWEGVVGSRSAMAEGRENHVALLGSLLAFQSDGKLVALEPATGDEAWVVPLGADPDCGPMGAAGWAEVTTPTLVCLTGPAADREAMVIGPDGVIAAGRPLEAADERRYGSARPGPDGMVLRAKRVGPAPAGGLGDAECTATTGECSGTVEAGRDLELRAEDAMTGAERWTVTVPFRPTGAGQCNNWSGTSWDRSDSLVDLDEMLDADAFSAHITGELVQLYGCGIEVGVTLAGVALGLEIEPGMGAVSSLRNGAYMGYGYDDEVRTTLYTAEGDVVGGIEGYVFQPGSVVGSGPGTLLASGRAGTRLQAFEPDGTPRWDTAMQANVRVFLAQVADTAIVGTGTGAVYGLGLATGEERWAWNGSDSDGGRPGELYVVRGFTDGQSVLLVTHNGSGATGLVSLDVLTGEVAWEQQALTDPGYGGFLSGLVAVDGNLLEVMPDGVRGLG